MKSFLISVLWFVGIYNVVVGVIDLRTMTQFDLDWAVAIVRVSFGGWALQFWTEKKISGEW